MDEYIPLLLQTQHTKKVLCVQLLFRLVGIIILPQIPFQMIVQKVVFCFAALEKPRMSYCARQNGDSHSTH